MNLRFTPRSAIVWSGVAISVLDGVYASVANELRGISTDRVWKFVASGAVGRRAFRGGAEMVALGLTFHVLIAFCVAAVFCTAARRLPLLTRHYLVAGLIYGIGVHTFMTFIVLPLSAAPPLAFSWKGFLLGLIPHLICVGLPVAWIASRTRQG
jgi:hypothetical protein